MISTPTIRGRTGKGTIVAEALKNMDADLERLLTTSVPIHTLDGLDLRSANPIALLYQTGYLNIKDYESEGHQSSFSHPDF